MPGKDPLLYYRIGSSRLDLIAMALNAAGKSREQMRRRSRLPEPLTH
jgi:hypothetical protein